MSSLPPHLSTTAPKRVDSIVLARGDTIWKRAASGNVDGLATIVAKGGDLDLADGKGRTALWHAIDQCQSECVAWILSQHPPVDVEVADEEGVTPRALAQLRRRQAKGAAIAEAQAIADLLDHAAGTKTRLNAPLNVISE
uniref:Ankyrin repeat domain-containing protein n=1 Tax=Sexangularia sp. CB-2014 TaxID=1486929 RepID=A0A7S1YBZ6_9EUKA